MTVQRTKPHNPTLAHLVPGIALLALAAAFVVLGFALRLTIDAALLPQESWREAQSGIRIAFQVAGFAGLAGVVLLTIGMLSYTLDLMRLWSVETPPAEQAAQPLPSQAAQPQAAQSQQASQSRQVGEPH